MISLPSNLDVAQVGNLLFRRLAVGRPAGCQPATQQTASLRYTAAASGYGAPGAHQVRGILSSTTSGKLTGRSTNIAALPASLPDLEPVLGSCLPIDNGGRVRCDRRSDATLPILLRLSLASAALFSLIK